MPQSTGSFFPLPLLPPCAGAMTGRSEHAYCLCDWARVQRQHVGRQMRTHGDMCAYVIKQSLITCSCCLGSSVSSARQDMLRGLRWCGRNSIAASDLASTADLCMMLTALLLRAVTGRVLFSHTAAAWRHSGAVHVQLRNDAAISAIGLEHLARMIAIKCNTTRQSGVA
jgi:hypothetical protein